MKQALYVTPISSLGSFALAPNVRVANLYLCERRPGRVTLLLEGEGLPDKFLMAPDAEVAYVGRGSPEEAAVVGPGYADAVEVCRKLDDLDWVIGYELGTSKNHDVLDTAQTLARHVLRNLGLLPE